MQTIEVSVSVDCAECESKIKKSLLKLNGVQQVDVDRRNQKVRVTGSIDQKKILKTVRKCGKRAVLCPYPYNPAHHAHNPEYYYQYQAVPAHGKSINGELNSYNYRVHGYDNYQLPGYNHGAPPTHLVGDRAHSLFSDDNPNACSIM
ncbi:heavy metal-associated isoprenylated plant protein 26-like protein [Carex littledalei]|uniref:Heavy metal-associated isoprenylated plant protein 26-like protein n=1 Tax=Carex littledalei TaxID=544730 RepID=A0A833RCX3_9POAL|nr:heavy metal-associated isoprenylated plant protein 26-like protein [Carex littledalei]